MPKLKSRKIFFMCLVVLFLSVFFSVGYFFIFKNRNAYIDSSYVQTSFPSSEERTAMSGDGKWVFRSLQGIVNDYSEENGKTVLLLDYVDFSGSVKQTKVIVSLGGTEIERIKKKFPAYFKETSPYSAMAEMYLKNKWMISSWAEYGEQSKGKLFLPAQEIKKIYPKGIGILVLLPYTFPDSSELSSGYCNINWENCLLYNLNVEYAGDMHDFWKTSNLQNDKYLFPVLISGDIVKKNTR